MRDRYNTGAIHLDFKSSPNYAFIGDSVRISLKGYDVGYNASTGMLEIDSVDYEKHFTKYGSGATPQPVDLDLSGINYTDYLCELVRINNVGFIPADTNQIYADAINQLSVNRTLSDCSGKQIVVRTSNYANFASKKTPKGFGSIIGIATAYGTTNQLSLRKSSEVSMNGAGCTIYLQKDFEDNSLTSGVWSVQNVLGSNTWSVSTFSGATFAKVSGYYSAANQNTQTWFISPPINLSASNNPALSFETMANFTGSLLEVVVSTNYTSGSPSTATWTNLTGFNLSSTGYALTASGLISLNSFKNSNTRIAFKYVSTTAGAKTYEVDNIVVREN
ncbi:MAG: choice-of-anchor J domain-containing protein [Sphingobacteriaceae bacterium]|nr:choice-of-anchor J domain-containing protein [Sphingobacteriaceae bacterium]